MLSASDDSPLGIYVLITGVSLRQTSHKPSRKLDVLLNNQIKPSVYDETQNSEGLFRWKVTNLRIFPDDTLKVIARRGGFTKYLITQSPLCEWTCSGAELLEQCRKESDQSDSLPVTLSMRLIHFAANDVDQMPLPSTDDLRDPSKLENIIGGLKSAYTYVENNAQVLESLDGGKQILDAIGEIHPFAKAAVVILTIPYKIWKKKREYEQSLRELQDALKSLLKRILLVHPATVVEELKDVIISIVKAFLDGVCLLEVYSSSNGMKKLFTAQFHSELDTFKKTLADLEKDLSNAGLDQVVVHVQDIHRTQSVLVSEQEASKVRSQLRPVELSNIQNYCLAGTREAILAKVDDWIESEERRNILWITGQPGSGKSTIAATVFKKYKARSARFFFKRDEERLCRARNVWRTIAYSLAKLYPEIMSFYVKVVESSSDYAQDTSINEQFQQLVQEPLKTLPMTRCPLIIVDALDECDSGEEFPKLLETLRMWNSCSKHCKLIITSRDYQQIRQALEYVSDPIELLTGDAVDDASSDDVHCYLIERFASIDPARTWPGQQKINELTSVAAGLFIWAKVALDFLGPVLFEAQERLRRIPGDLGSQRQNLDSLYIQVLQSAFSSLEGEKEVNRQKRVLSAIVSVKNPLSSETLSHLLGLPVRAVNNAVQRLSAVIPRCPEGQPLRICHKSFLDFMASQLSASSSPYALTCSQVHAELASSTLTTLQDGLRFNICRLETSFLFNEEFPELEASIQKYIPSQLSYAAQFWASHISEVKDLGIDSLSSPLLASCVKNMLSSHFLHWLEVLSLIGAPGAASEQLLTCAKWARDIAHNRDLFSTTMDANRFASEFRYVLDHSALHVYQSAFPFAPEASLVHQAFGVQFETTVKVKKGRSAMWAGAQYIMYGHSNIVTSTAFSPDGKKIVSGSDDNTVRIWDAETGASIGEPLHGHTNYVNSVAFSPDGKKIVSGSNDNTVRVWDAETGASISESLCGHINPLNSMVFSSRGTVVCSEQGDHPWEVLSHTKASSDKENDPLSNGAHSMNSALPIPFSAFLDNSGRFGPPESCYLDDNGWLTWPYFGLNETKLEYKVLWLPLTNRKGYRSPRCKLVIGNVTETLLDWSSATDVACPRR